MNQGWGNQSWNWEKNGKKEENIEIENSKQRIKRRKKQNESDIFLNTFSPFLSFSIFPFSLFFPIFPFSLGFLPHGTGLLSLYWKCNFPMNPYVHPLVGWLIF